MRRRPLLMLMGVILALGVALSGCAGAIKRIQDAAQRAREGGRAGGPFDRFKERSPKTVKKQLGNGLTVVVQENFGAPVVAVQVWVKVGAADESDPEAGIAHLLEHMVFKGTTNRPVGRTALDVESLGGDINAFTSYDNTVFQITIASRYSDQALEILSDLVQNAQIAPTELAREKEVVLEEIRRSRDNPRSRIYKYLFDRAYKVHTYRRPVIGFENTVSGFTSEDVKGFYRKWYTAANMTVVVSGMVDNAEALRSAKRYFGDVPGGSMTQDKSSRNLAEPPQKSPREMVWREDVSEGYLYLGFHVPPFGAEDVPALDLLSVILGGGETSRLVYRVRTERRLVNKVWAYSYTPRDAGLFMIGCDLAETKADQALDMVLKQVYLLKYEPVEDWELEKAKLTIETENIYARETVDGQARQLGFYVTLTGDPEYDRTYMQRVKAVTKEDLQRAANKYFLGRNLSAVAILPPAKAARKKKDKPSFNESTMHWIVQDVDGWETSYTPGSLPEPESIVPPEIPTAEETPATSGKTSPATDPVKFVLKNGIRLIVRENSAVPLVSVRAAFEAGLRRETLELNGVTNFIAETITRGTVNSSASQINSLIEARAGQLAGFAGMNSLGVTLEVPSPYFYSCLPLFAEVIRYPTFPEEEIEGRRGIIISSIKSQLDQPRSLVLKLFRSELFHDHPFGMDVLGSEASVSRLTRDDLMNFYQTFAVPGNLVIAVVGDVKAETVRARMEELFADWVAEPYVPEPVNQEYEPETPRQAMVCRELNQSNLVIGFLGARLTSEDRYPLSVLTSVLSGMSGRLFTRLRGEQSLAYSVYAFNEEGLDPGVVGVYIGTAAEKEETSRQGIIEELERVREAPVSADELKRAQQVLIGDFEIGLQQLRNQAAHYALDELYGLGFRDSELYPERIEAVTPQAVYEIARKYLRLEHGVTAVVRPCAAPYGAADLPPGPADGPGGNSWSPGL